MGMLNFSKNWRELMVRKMELNKKTTVNDLRLGQRFTFQQDKDPKRSVSSTTEWVRSKLIDV